MNKILLGDIKNGCRIDNEIKVITYFEPQSFYEKVRKKENITSIPYCEIKEIMINSSIVNGVRFGSTTMSLTIHLNNQEILEWPLYFLYEDHQKYVDFARLLLESHIKIIDKNNLLETIVNNPDKHIGTIIDEVSKKK